MATSLLTAPSLGTERVPELPGIARSANSGANSQSITAIAWLVARLALAIGLVLVGAWILMIALAGQNMPWNFSEIPYTPMSPAAEQYWRNLDVVQVQRDMASWKREDLAQLFRTAQYQSFDPATRQHLEELGKVLRLPGFVPSSSLLPILFTQPGFLVGITLTLSMWLAAAVIGVAPLVRRRTAQVASFNETMAQALPADSELLELLPELSLDTVTVGDDTNTEEKKAEEKKDEQQKDPAETQDGEEASSSLGDLASLFEEEDTSITALETFCRNLADIGIDSLVTRVKETARDLRSFLAMPLNEKST